MKEQILKKMISVVDATMESFKSDFYTYDLKTLARLSESTKFFWLCDKNHTSLAIVDYDYLQKTASESEACRFHYMHDVDNVIGGLSYWIMSKSETMRVLYYDGEELHEGVNAHYVYDIVTPIYEQLKHWIKCNYPDEVEYYRKEQNIYFSSSEVREQFMGVLRNADNPESLLNAVRTKRYHNRLAVNEKVVIGYDYEPKSFSFYHERNGKVILNGGIIYSKATDKQPEHWSTHT